MNINYNKFWKIRRNKPYNNRLTKQYYKELTAVNPTLIKLFEQGENLIKDKNKNILSERVLEDESITIRTNINIIICKWLQTNPKNTKKIKYVYDNLMGELQLFNRE
jgi:hypothetical protein